VVFIGVYHVSYAVDTPLRPLFAAVGKHEAETVSFEVVFAHDQYAVLVAELVKRGTVGIMAGADGRNVVFKADFEVSLDFFNVHGMACFGVEFVAVYAANLEGLAVKKYKRSSSVLHGDYLDFSEAEIGFPLVDELVAVF